MLFAQEPKDVYYLNKIQKLEKAVDSLKSERELYKAHYQASSHNTVTNEVKDFYQDSFDNLLWLLGGLITVFGIIIPFLNQYFQRKSLNDLTGRISNQLTEAFEQRLEVLNQNSKTQIERINSAFQSEIERINSIMNEKFIEFDKLSEDFKFQIKGMMFYSQGSANVAVLNTYLGIFNFLFAAEVYLDLHDTDNYELCIANIFNLVDSIDKETISNLESHLQAYDYTIDKFMHKFINNYTSNINLQYLEVIHQKFNEFKYPI
jgi:hypothetical protein